jgi:hypothetical protein
MSINTRIASATLCPDLRKHTKAPSGYVAWHEWAEKKAETHTQQECPTCGRLVIWKPKLRLVPALGEDA